MSNRDIQLSSTARKSTTTVSKSSSSSSSYYSSTSASKSVKSSSRSSQQVSIQQSGQTALQAFGDDFGFKDIDTHMGAMDDEFNKMRSEMFKRMNMLALEPAGSPGEVTKLDSKALMEYIDDMHKDKLKFNFDVKEFQSESVNVKTNNNRIEIHAKRAKKVGDETKEEEFSRTYELPGDVNPAQVTSSVFKDGILTIELPVAAVEDKKE